MPKGKLVSKGGAVRVAKLAFGTVTTGAIPQATSGIGKVLAAGLVGYANENYVVESGDRGVVRVIKWLGIADGLAEIVLGGKGVV